jgi:hypothetical protein
MDITPSFQYVPRAGSNNLSFLRKEHRELFLAVTDVINRVDPLLISFVGRFEYDLEVADIMVYLKFCQSKADVRDLVFDVFSFWFGPEMVLGLLTGGYEEELLSLKSLAVKL